jgi:hypothetical protein
MLCGPSPRQQSGAVEVPPRPDTRGVQPQFTAGGTLVSAKQIAELLGGNWTQQRVDRALQARNTTTIAMEFQSRLIGIEVAIATCQPIGWQSGSCRQWCQLAPSIPKLWADHRSHAETGDPTF